MIFKTDWNIYKKTYDFDVDQKSNLQNMSYFWWVVYKILKLKSQKIRY